MFVKVTGFWPIFMKIQQIYIPCKFILVEVTCIKTSLEFSFSKEIHIFRMSLRSNRRPMERDIDPLLCLQTKNSEIHGKGNFAKRGKRIFDSSTKS